MQNFYEFLQNINISAEYKFMDRTVLISEDDAQQLVDYIGTLSLENILKYNQLSNQTNFNEFRKLCCKAKIKRYMNNDIQF